MSAVLLPNGKQAYVTASGTPAVGYKLFTYNTGTAINRPTWSDAAMAVLNANPVVLDARGEAVIFWSGAYRVRLEDPVGNLIWQVDGVAVADASAVGFDPAANYPSGSIGKFLTDAYGRNAAEIAAGIIPVNYFKLPCDVERYATNSIPGTTDMSAAFANASTVSAGGGGDVLVRSLIRLSANTTLASGATLRTTQGGKMTVDAARTLTVAGKLIAPRTEIFTGSGTVLYDNYLSGNDCVAFPEWFGAIHNNSFDCTAAMTKSLAMVAPAFGAVSLTNGYYRVLSTLTIPTRVSIFGISRDQSVIIFAPTTNGDDLFVDAGTGTLDNEFHHFGIAVGGANTGQRGFTLSSAASKYRWHHMDFSGLQDWAIAFDQAQHIYITDCTFGNIHNATDTGVAIRTTTYANRVTIDNNRFFNNDRDVIIATGSSVSICRNAFEGTGSLAATKRLSVNLVAVSGFKVDCNYFEAVRTDPNGGVIEIESSYSGSVDCNHIVGDFGGTTYSARAINFLLNSRGCRANNNTINEVLSLYINAGNFVVECHGNRYVDGGVQMTTYQTVVALLGNPNNIDLDLPFTFTFDPPNIASGASATSAGQAITGARFGDTYRVAAPYDLQDLSATAYTQANNTVEVLLLNLSGGARDLASGTWSIFRQAGNL